MRSEAFATIVALSSPFANVTSNAATGIICLFSLERFARRFHIPIVYHICI